MKKQERKPIVGLNVSAERLKLLSDAFPSVLDLSGASVSQLLALDPLMHISEAREVLERAKTAAVVTARLFRERRLSTGVRTAYSPGNGVKGLVQGPTYNDMFTPNWAEMCPPNAIEATTSPIAYLTDLYREVHKIEATAKGRSFPLATRRPDLAGLMLDHTALNQIVPTLTLSNEILETSISQFLNEHHGGLAVDDALLKTRYPMGLPYERYQQQITYVLGRKKQSPGDAIRSTDIHYPYFKEPGVHSLRSDDALQQDTGLGPEQQSLLLEAPYFPFGGAEQSDKQGAVPSAPLRINPRSRLIEDEEIRAVDFFQRHYGVIDSGELFDTQTFCLRTGITTDELDSLLSVGPYAPTVSPNGGVTVAPIDGATFGSVYINGGTSPAIAIETLTDSATGADGSVVTVTLGHILVNCTPDRFDRMNRMLRLAKWLKLPFDQVDRLLCAALEAERGTQSATWQITPDTLRALGLFQSLRDSHKVTADDFAALIGGLGVYGLGKELSQFDRVFNSQALFPTPLILDNTELSGFPSSEVQRRRVDQLCVALGMTNETYRFCSAIIQQAQGGTPLRWTRAVVSAFYRLTRIPRYLGLSAIEVVALLELMDNGGSLLVATLAGFPHIATYPVSTNTDTVSTLHALFDINQWMNEHQWTVALICRLIQPTSTEMIVTGAHYEQLRQMLEHMSQQLSTSLITDSSFIELGASNASPVQLLDAGRRAEQKPIDWFTELQAFIYGSADTRDFKGLVRSLNGETDTTFEAQLSTAICTVLTENGYDLSDTGLLSKLVNMVMRARGLQETLLMEGLGNYLAVPADMAKQLLVWVGTSREVILKEVMRVTSGPSGASEPGVTINDAVLQVLDSMAKRAAITLHLELSAALVTLFTQHPQWFALYSNEITLSSLYSLSQYAYILRFSQNGEDVLLDYFNVINNAWPSEVLLPGDPGYEAQKSTLRLIRNSAAYKLAAFLRWGVREVLQVAAHANSEHGVVFTLRELDLLVRARLFGQQVGLDAQAMLALGNLGPRSSLQTYRYAAELALTSLNETILGRPEEEVGQSNISQISVSQDQLVGNDNGASTAVVTLILLDMLEEPLNGVKIIWSSNLGVLSTNESVTDEQGLASVTLSSGAVLGIAQVVAEFGLGEKILAPVINIDCDESTLSFKDSSAVPTTALPNNIQLIEFKTKLMDIYGNAGQGRKIEWGTSLEQSEFERYMSYTDKQGVVTASLRSPVTGSANVVAQYVGGASEKFEPVIFSDTSEGFFRFASTPIVNINATVECKAVTDQGRVLASSDVKWSASNGKFINPQGRTDDTGRVNAPFRGADAGDAIITITVTDPQTLETMTRELVQRIHPLPVVISREPASTETIYIIKDTPVVCSIELDTEVPGEVVWKDANNEILGAGWVTVEESKVCISMTYNNYGEYRVEAYFLGKKLTVFDISVN